MELNSTIIYMLIGSLFLLILAILGVLAYFVYRLTKNHVPLDAKSDEKGKEVFFSPAEKLPTPNYCTNHEENKAASQCAICNDYFCSYCISPIDEINFCHRHATIYKDNDWKILEKVIATPDTSDRAAHLFYFKNETWKTNQQPTYVLTQYKINFEGDHIESHIQLFTTEGNFQEHTLELDRIKNQIKNGIIRDPGSQINH